MTVRQKCEHTGCIHFWPGWRTFLGLHLFTLGHWALQSSSTCQVLLVPIWKSSKVWWLALATSMMSQIQSLGKQQALEVIRSGQQVNVHIPCAREYSISVTHCFLQSTGTAYELLTRQSWPKHFPCQNSLLSCSQSTKYSTKSQITISLTYLCYWGWYQVQMNMAVNLHERNCLRPDGEHYSSH